MKRKMYTICTIIQLNNAKADGRGGGALLWFAQGPVISVPDPERQNRLLDEIIVKEFHEEAQLRNTIT